MEDTYVKKIITTIILAILIVLSFFLLKSILLSIITGLILAFIFSPVYKRIHQRIKSKNFSAFIVCLIFLMLIILPLILLIPSILNQITKIYLASQQVDFVTPLKTIFPSYFTSGVLSEGIQSAADSFISKIVNSLAGYLSLDNFILYFLKLVVVLFTFFFALRDKDQLVSYIKTISPFSSDVEKKLFKSSREITQSVIYGQVVVGLIQGLIVGVGLFIFKVPNALFLTFLAALTGIFPVVGTVFIWLPVAVYLFIAGNILPSIGMIGFGLFSSTIDNFLRPIIVSRRTKMNSLFILIGMIGGLSVFGFLGIILGPLILAYLLILLEIYRNKKSPGIFAITEG